MSADPSGLSVSDVYKRFGDTTALEGVSLEIADGQMVVLLGPSGCGKTTLLRIIAGLERADRGSVVIAGEQLVGSGCFVPPERRRIGMVFQDWALFPHLTVERNVAYGLTKDQVRKGRVAETLELMEMGDLAHRKPDELSAGQAQRVALARALAPRPRLLLFDEPFSSLDAELRVSVRRDVAALMRAVEMTAVFVTHDQEEAFILGDQVAVMNGGNIVQFGCPADIYRSPASAWVAGFVGDANLVPGVGVDNGNGRGNSAETALGTIPTVDDVSGTRLVLVRPEHLTITAGGQGDVIDVDYFGHDTTYRIRVTSQDRKSVSALTVRQISAPLFAIGDRVDMSYQGPPTTTFPKP